jgi:signal transduction histidine kinase
MSWFRERRGNKTWIITATVGGLLIVLMIAGTVGLVINRHVNDVARDALDNDVRLEDTGDDLRAAVLDLRHYHRNIVFAGPSRGGIEDFDSAYRMLQTEIDQYEELGFTDPGIPEATTMRTEAERYYTEFRPAIELYPVDRQAFTVASDDGLIRIATLEEMAREIDEIGDERATSALENVEESTRTATFDLVVVLAGLAIVGAGLAYLTVRTTHDMRALYAEQEATSQELARALEARNQFIADVSHELRTPITVLRGNAEVGLELDRGGVHGQILEEIVKESTRMSRLVEDLLFLARSDANTVPLDLHTVAVPTLLSGLREPAGVLAQQHGATLVADLKGSGQITVDAERIEQAVQILVDNAAKYAASECPIALTSHVESGSLVISVRDDGPGIPEEELPLIFERFHRVDKTRSRKLGGAGLGLAIARSIVEAHGGRITAESKPNHGTTMTIHLPLDGARPVSS